MLTTPSKASERLAEAAALALLAGAFAFGGGSRGAGDLVVHLLAVAALPLAVSRAHAHPTSGRPQRAMHAWFAAVAVVLGLQLLPLPPALWQSLPLRNELTAELAAAGAPATWRPMSLDPWGTVRGLLWMLVGYSTFRLLGTLSAEAQTRWLKAAVLLGIAMALLGFAQAAAGRQPTLRFHPFHNEFGASGTFANRNHFALLMAMLAPLAIGLARHAQARRTPWSLPWYFAAVLLVLAAALSFSRAGFLLASAGAAAAALWAWRWHPPGQPAASRARHVLALGSAAALTALGIASYAWTQLAVRLEKDPLEDARVQYLEHGINAVKAFLPWGSGTGSFRWAYAPFEPQHDMSNTYALHAHNDLVEVALEAGVPGLLLIAAALGVLLWSVLAQRNRPHGAHPLLFVTCVTLVVPLLHSLVDYPLRTLSALVLFCGLLAQLHATNSLPTKLQTRAHN